MFCKDKLPEDVKQYTNAGSRARKNMDKYRKTGKTKYKDRAKENYDIRKALEIKMANPGNNVQNTSISVSDSFNKDKKTDVQVVTKINIKKPKSKKTKKK